MKKYKPGQIVTIEGKQYRIKKGQPRIGPACNQCKYDNNRGCEAPCGWCLRRLGYDFYLSPIKPE